MDGLKSYVLREIGNLSRAIQTVNEAKYKIFGLQKNQFVFLTRVVEHPGIQILDLANLLRVDKTTTSKAVRKLVDKGFIEKKQNERDNRIVHLFPMEKSFRVYDEILAEENRALTICLRGFDEAEWVSLESALRKMNENVRESWLEIKNRSDCN